MSSPHGFTPAQAPRVAFGRALDRRRFLAGTGILLALPLLDSMTPAFAAAPAASANPGGKPRRMLGICNNLGLVPENFFPKGAGADYKSSVYLDHLQEHRRDFSVFSGVSHPDVDGGHPADNCFLTAAPHPSSGGFRNTISLDQFVAERVGHLTRFPSLTLGVNCARGSRSLSWTAGGIMIPTEEKPSEVFRRMFMGGSAKEMAAAERRLDLGKSILDAVGGQAGDLGRTLGAQDRDRLDQYYTSVRELERRMQMSKEWERKPRPVATRSAPLDPASPKEYMDKVRLMYDMARLCFETDSSRTVTLMLDSVNSPAIELDHEHTTSDGYHNLSHHGRSAQKLAQLRSIDEWHMKLLAKLMSDLKSVKEEGDNLLDRTMILYGSNLGNANTHVTTNLPTIFAGGGFRHGEHHVFDTERNYPLPNLFVSMLQRMGLEADKFASSTGSMRGLNQLG